MNPIAVKRNAKLGVIPNVLDKLVDSSLTNLTKLTYHHNQNKRRHYWNSPITNKKRWQSTQSPFFLKEHPSVSLARPPVGWHKTVWQFPHTTTVWEWLKTVVMLKQPWHLTSMKKEFGDWTRRLSLCFLFSNSAGGFSKSISFWRTIVRKKRWKPQKKAQP